MFTLASSSDCLLLVLAVLTVLVPICLSYRRNAVFLAKYAYLYSTYTLMSIIIIVLCLPRPKDPRNAVMGAKIMKPFNKMISLTWTIRGIQKLLKDRGCVVVLNHQSSVDVCTLMEIWSLLERPLPFITPKRSIMYSGPFGLAAWLIGSVFIDRRSKTSHAAMDGAGDLAREEKRALFVFPEGTRNGTKNLTMLPFKKGAFHVAVNSGLPIVPVVVSQYDFLDVRDWRFSNGEVVVEVLDAIDSEEYGKDGVEKLADVTRMRMLETLAALQRELNEKKTI